VECVKRDVVNLRIFTVYEMIFSIEEADTMNAIYDLVKRVLPKHYEQVECEIINSDNDKDIYEIDWKKGKLILKGNNFISIATALGRYLRYDAKVNISWCGENMNLSENLPEAKKYRHVIEQKYRVYMNYCTFNYTASWWNFDRWEKEIDFMALNGINMPLTIVGIEACWYYTLLEFGFSDSDAREFLAGPVFLAWQWMGNLEGFGGPLPMSWIEKRVELGRKIFDRVLELGMMPIQQGFSGVVPRKLKELYPENAMKYQESWNGMKETVQLDPTDELFKKMGKTFLQKQKEIFGTYGFYAADPFHEGKPPVDGSKYLNEVGSIIHELFSEFDENSKWVMQAWSIRKDIVDSVPKDKLLILDLSGSAYKSKDNFWGYEFVLGNLHNFGGRIKLHGDISLLSENNFKSLKDNGINVVGTGLFMEGIEQNPVYYELAFDMLTRNDAVNPSEWLDEYILRRYGVKDENAKKAWDILLKTVYARGTNGVEKGSAICTRPAVNMKKTGPGPGFLMPYGYKRLYRALELLVSVKSETEGYKFDTADVLRQYLSDYAYELSQEISKSFLNTEKEKFCELSKKYIELIDDFDELLHTIPCYSFEKWVKDAVKWGENEEERKLYDYNATALVTIWGSDEDSILYDYAWREWAGLTREYYKKRWVFFFEKLEYILDNDLEYNEEALPNTVDSRPKWRANEIYNEMADIELEWIKAEKEFNYIYFDEENIIEKLMEKYI